MIVISKEGRETNIAYLHDQMKQYNEQNNPQAEDNLALRTKLKVMKSVEMDLRSEMRQLKDQLGAKEEKAKDRIDCQATTHHILNEQQRNFDYIISMLNHMNETVGRHQYVHEYKQETKQYGSVYSIINEEQNRSAFPDQRKEFIMEMNENKELEQVIQSNNENKELEQVSHSNSDSKDLEQVSHSDDKSENPEQVTHSNNENEIDQQATEIDTLKDKLTEMEEKLSVKENISESTTPAEDQNPLRASEHVNRRFTFRDIQQAQEVYAVPGKKQTTTYRNINAYPTVKEKQEKKNERLENKTIEASNPSTEIPAETGVNEEKESPREDHQATLRGNQADRKSFLKSIWDRMK